MQISFLKVKNNPLDIDYSKNGVDIKGELNRVDRDTIKLNSTLSSNVKLICNRCGKEFIRKIEYPLGLILSDGRYNSKDEIDVIEFFDGKIDFDYIAQSEITSIKEDFNYCDECSNSDEILEKEF